MMGKMSSGRLEMSMLGAGVGNKRKTGDGMSERFRESHGFKDKVKEESTEEHLHTTLS